MIGTVGRRLGRRWHVEATLGLAPAFDGASGYRVFEPRVGVRLGKRMAAALGIRFEELRYNDAHKQALANSLKARRRALPALSVRLYF